MNAQVGKWVPLAVRIPGTYARELGLAEGTELDLDARGRRSVAPPAEVRISTRGVARADYAGEHPWRNGLGLGLGREAW